MNDLQFKKIYNFIQDEKVVYVVVKRNHNFRMTENKSRVINEIEKLDNSEYLRVNVNILASGIFTFQNVPKGDNCNSFLITHHVLEKISSKIGVSVENLLLHKDVMLRTLESIKRQQQRRIENKERCKANLERKNIMYATKKDSKELISWANENKKRLEESATQYERILFNKLKRTFKNKIKAQQPFLINKKLYYADIYIPSLKLIIEVDGGYHTTKEQSLRDAQRDADFASIGYTTMRFTNEQVASKEGKKDIIKTIMDYTDRFKKKRYNNKHNKL